MEGGDKESKLYFYLWNGDVKDSLTEKVCVGSISLVLGDLTRIL